MTKNNDWSIYQKELLHGHRTPLFNQTDHKKGFQFSEITKKALMDPMVIGYFAMIGACAGICGYSIASNPIKIQPSKTPVKIENFTNQLTR